MYSPANSMFLIQDSCTETLPYAPGATEEAPAAGALAEALDPLEPLDPPLPQAARAARLRAPRPEDARKARRLVGPVSARNADPTWEAGVSEGFTVSPR